jgi:uncharacterized protein (TIGR02145 family)
MNRRCGSILSVLFVMMSSGINAGQSAPQPPQPQPQSKRMADGKLWMTQNLAVSSVPSFCFDDDETKCSERGRLYTWESAQKACAALGDGWRIPTDAEWRQLAKHYGGVFQDTETTDRGKTSFAAMLTGGSSGFNATLGGNRNEEEGTYGRANAHGFYWTATERDAKTAPYYNFGAGSKALYRQEEGSKRMAVSVRCVKD